MEGEIALVEQSAGKVGTATTGDECGRCTHMHGEQSAELAGRVSDMGGEGFLVEAVEEALGDQTNRRAHGKR